MFTPNSLSSPTTIVVSESIASFLKPLSKEDGRSGDGTNPAVLVLDEYHQHPTTEFYDLGLGGNAGQSLIIIITTAGKDLNAPCFTQEYKFVSKLERLVVSMNKIEPCTQYNCDKQGEE